MTHLIYAVGDVHGRSDLVRQVLSRVRRHAGSHSYQIVFLGDYIDRGEDARGVIELLVECGSRERVVCLRGNHEEMLACCLRDEHPEAFNRWMSVGGGATMVSYGGCATDHSSLDRIPQRHRTWLITRPVILEDTAHIFVHAGIDPHRELVEQTQHDMLWIRDRFVQAPARTFLEPRHIVHGHTMIWAGKPDPALPELLPHRTNLDTGAFLTDVLTIGVFEGGQRRGPIDLLSIF